MLKYTKIRNVKNPNRGTPLSAGIDFYIPESNDFYVKLQLIDNKSDNIKLSEPIKVVGSYTLKPGESVLIPSGIKTYFTPEYALIAFNKSGIASKYSILVGAEVIDQDYQGEIHFDLKNVGNKDIKLHPGDKITQLILVKIGLDEPQYVETEEELYNNTKTQRGEGGFGSTGSK